jgi:hypothetical protein
MLLRNGQSSHIFRRDLSLWYGKVTRLRSLNVPMHLPRNLVTCRLSFTFSYSVKSIKSRTRELYSFGGNE